MRITLVSPFDPRPAQVNGARAHVGGVERVFAHIASNLARRGHDVSILCTTDDRPGTSRVDGVDVVRQTRRFTVFRTPVARLARDVPRDADIVQVAGTYPFTTPAVLRRARRLDVPAILDFHFEPAPGTRLGRWAAAAYRLVGPRSYPLADAVLVRSLAYARAAPSLRRVPEHTWRVVPNGIDAAHFTPDGPRREGDYLLFVGRLVPYKGVDVLLKALAHLREAPRLLVAGDGPQRGKLEALAWRLGVDARFLGYVPDDSLPALYRGARLTILPSVTAQEAFGMALVESMACGTPVVASSLPGVADVAHLGGLVARTGDAVSTAEQIRFALKGADLPRGDGLARRVHAEYSWDAVTQRLLDVYDEVLGRRRPQRASDLEVMPSANPRGHPVL